jgi:hypothetical protein
MAKTKTLLIDIVDPTTQYNALEVSIFYDEGGMNYFTSQVNKRGFYASVLPTLVRKQNGYTSRTITMFEGAKVLLLETSRFSQKKLDSIDFNDNRVHDLVRKYSSGKFLPCYTLPKGEFVVYEG